MLKMTRFRLLFLLLLCGGSNAVKVLEFQKDGVTTLFSAAEYTGQLDRTWMLRSLTLCTRFQLFYMHSRGTFFELRDRLDNLNAQLKGELWLDRVRLVIANQWKFQLIKENFNAYRWYHLCFTYDHNNHRYNTYVDGYLNYATTYDVGRPVYGDYIRLGQGDDATHSFSGALSQVSIWDHPLNANTIAEIAACRIDPKGNYVSWDAGWAMSNVTEYNIPLKNFCEEEEKTTYLWFPHTTWSFATYICQALGTQLPLPATMDEVRFWYNLTAKIWPDKPSLCHDGFWTPLEDNTREGVWAMHYDNTIIPSTIWKIGEPNGIMYENCANIGVEGVEDIDCLTDRRCTVCKFTERHTFALLGTCEAELRNIYFTVSQQRMDQLRFQGYGDYQIRKENGRWLWFNIATNQTLARLDLHAPLGKPMGRRTWHLETPVCDQVSGTRILTLSPCPANSYTCSDATCIPHDNRCDYKIDCRDRSDELNCELVRLQDDYNKNVPPRVPNKNETVAVAIEITIESVNVVTTLMTMLVSYKLKMTWFDSRLTFRDLKFNESLNIVSEEIMMSLWIPHIDFVNTVGNQDSKVGEGASLHLQRLQPHTHMDNSAPGEVRMFPGADNPLTISRNYHTTFTCNFNLILYPFDDQHCDMHLRILSASKEYVTVDHTATTVTYIGSELLLEYQLLQQTVHFDNSHSHSEVRIRLPFKRRRGYALCDIYIPSFVLLIIGYLSLFFRPHIFEVRIMTTLTSLLVMATLFSQVSAALPKTSYFKIVDVWLLFCIVMSFLIIIFHTIIDISLGNYTIPESTPGLMKVVPLPSPTRRSPTPALKSLTGKVYGNLACKICRRFSTRTYIAMAQYSISGMFVLFNIVYWSYIFA